MSSLSRKKYFEFWYILPPNSFSNESLVWDEILILNPSHFSGPIWMWNCNLAQAVKSLFLQINVVRWRSFICNFIMKNIAEDHEAVQLLTKNYAMKTDQLGDDDQHIKE